MKGLAVFTLFLVFCTMPIMAKTVLIDKIPVSEKIVALTLEDVEDKTVLESILTICRQEKVRLTLFCPGQFVKKQPKGIRELLGLGSEVGVCGIKYQPWDELRGEEIRREYLLAKSMLPKGTAQRPLVRPPYDYYDESVLDAFSGDDIILVRGTGINGVISAGSIINIKMQDKDALTRLQCAIIQLKRQGYQLETVEDMLKKSSLTTSP